MAVNHLDELIAAICDRLPRHAAFLLGGAGGLDDRERADADAYVEHCLRRHCSLPDLVDAYIQIVQDTLQEQIYFRRHGRYRHSTIKEVAAYSRGAYMRPYMLGLGLTNYLWPNHLSMMHYFIQTLPRDLHGGYLEVGPGHGLYFREAMRCGAFASYTGIDISPESLALTQALIEDENFPDERNYRLLGSDFLVANLESGYQGVVMGEVLEHTEEPVAFLRRLQALAAPDAYLFVSTCINAPAVDHIHRYDSEAAIERQVREAGLRIKERWSLPYFGKSMEESVSERLAINVAMVLAVAPRQKEERR